MTEFEQRRLAEFVDRVDEMDRFCSLLESDNKHIMIVWGETGIGKTSLRLRMVHECAQRKLRKAEIECGGIRTTGYLSIMRKIRDDLGLQYFNPFSDYASFLTEPGYQPKLSLDINVHGNITVGGAAQITGSSVGDIAGIVIKDNMISAPRSDISVPEEERMMRLTDRFIEGLNATALDGMPVIFLDAVEKMAPDTKRWLWEELLLAIRDGRIPKAKFVLCVEEQQNLDRDWRELVEVAELRPLEIQHIEAYLEKRGVAEGSRKVIAMTLLVTTKGKISLIADGVDLFLDLQKKLQQ